MNIEAHQLATLLRSFFNCAELRGFMHSLDGGQDILAHMPHSGSSLMEASTEAAHLLDRWGVSAADLYSKLYQHRPTRVAELMTYHRLTTTSPTTVNIRRTISIELTASIEGSAVGIYRLSPGQVKVIGRSSDAEIQFPGDLVKLSRLHAWVSWPSSGPMLQDLDSKNGTWINGRCVSRTPLRQHDRIRLGEVELLIHEPDRTETADPPREEDTLS